MNADNEGKTKQCAICNKILLKTNYRKHLKWHTTKCPELRVQCTETGCGMRFVSRASLRRHTKSIHKAKEDDKRLCRKCNVTFATRNLYEAHRRNLHAQFEFCCLYCDPSIMKYTKALLMKHLRESHYIEGKSLTDFAMIPYKDDCFDLDDEEQVTVKNQTHFGFRVKRNGSVLEIGDVSKKDTPIVKRRKAMFKSRTNFIEGAVVEFKHIAKVAKPGTSTFFGVSDQYCMHATTNIPYVEFIGQHDRGSFIKPKEYTRKKGEPLEKPDIKIKIDAPKLKNDKPTKESIEQDYHVYFKDHFKTPEFKKAVKEIKGARLLNKCIVLVSMTIHAYNTHDKKLDADRQKETGEGKHTLDVLFYAHSLLGILIPGDKRMIVFDPAKPGLLMKKYVPIYGRKFAKLLGIDVKEENVKYVGLDFQVGILQRCCVIFTNRFVDEIIKQHMINLKNRVFNYDWINEEFAKSLRLYDDEVAVYRKHMAIKGIALGTILDAPPELAKALPKKKREERVTYNCKKCEAPFANKRNFEIHQDYDVHWDANKKYTCPIKACGKKIGRKIKNHVDTHFIVGEIEEFDKFPIMYCPGCKDEFDCASVLIKHINTMTFCSVCKTCYAGKPKTHTKKRCLKRQAAKINMNGPEISLDAALSVGIEVE